MTREDAVLFAIEIFNDSSIEDIGYCYNDAQKAVEALQPASPGWQSKALKLWEETGCDYNTLYAVRRKSDKQWLFNMEFDEGDEGAFFMSSVFEDTEGIYADDFDLVVEMNDVLQQPPQPKDCDAEGQPQQGGCEGDSARDDISKIIRDMQNDWDTDYDIVRAIIHYLGTPITTTTEEGE